MKRYQRPASGLKKTDGDGLEGKSLFVTIFLGGDDGTWRGPIRILVDSGCDVPLVLPKSLLDRLGISYVVTGTEQSELANGETAEFETGYISVKVVTTDGLNPAFVDVPCSFIEAEPLFGVGLLSLFRYTVDGGMFVTFEVDEDAFDQLDDFEGRIKYVPTSRDRATLKRVAYLNVQSELKKYEHGRPVPYSPSEGPLIGEPSEEREEQARRASRGKMNALTPVPPEQQKQSPFPLQNRGPKSGLSAKLKSISSDDTAQVTSLLRQALAILETNTISTKQRK